MRGPGDRRRTGNRRTYRYFRRAVPTCAWLRRVRAGFAVAAHLVAGSLADLGGVRVQPDPRGPGRGFLLSERYCAAVGHRTPPTLAQDAEVWHFGPPSPCASRVTFLRRLDHFLTLYRNKMAQAWFILSQPVRGTKDGLAAVEKTRNSRCHRGLDRFIDAPHVIWHRTCLHGRRLPWEMVTRHKRQAGPFEERLPSPHGSSTERLASMPRRPLIFVGKGVKLVGPRE